jgi:hypothetical protein
VHAFTGSNTQQSTSPRRSAAREVAVVSTRAQVGSRIRELVTFAKNKEPAPKTRPKAFCKPTIYTGNADAIRLTPPKVMTLEQAIAYIDDDEMVEVTPKNIRIRKALLDPNERKKASRKRAA